MTVSVGLGLMEFPFGGGRAYWRWVDLCEESGLDSIWQTDRLLSREPMLECMSVMAALAGRTSRLKFGMNVVSLALRDPVLLAKQCATIDVLSEGRLLPAFGIGSPRAPEWTALHNDTKTRGRKTDEALEVIGRLWREENVDFVGEHFRLTGASISPKPFQANLPMWIGGGSEAAIQRTARVGTGWLGGPETPAETRKIVAAIRAAQLETGRTIEEDHYGASFPFHFGRAADRVLERPMQVYERRTSRDPRGYFAIGDADAIVSRLKEYIDAGISKFVLRPAVVGDEAVMGQTQRLIKEVLPAVARRWPKLAKKQE